MTTTTMTKLILEMQFVLGRLGAFSEVPTQALSEMTPPRRKRSRESLGSGPSPDSTVPGSQDVSSQSNCSKYVSSSCSWDEEQSKWMVRIWNGLRRERKSFTVTADRSKGDVEAEARTWITVHHQARGRSKGPKDDENSSIGARRRVQHGHAPGAAAASSDPPGSQAPTTPSNRTRWHLRRSPSNPQPPF